MNVSQSKIHDLQDCSMAFYLKHVLLLPDRPHWKTSVGSALHNVIEFCLKPKRRKLLDPILANGFSFVANPSINRYCLMWRDHYRIDKWDHKNVEEMIALVFVTLKPYLIEGRFISEQRFEEKIGSATVSGFLDVMTLGDDARMFDMKTKGKKFTKDEIDDNIQAQMYAWYYHRKHGKLVPMHFIMTRFPPTKKDTGRHIQTVMPPTESQLKGLEIYLEHVYGVMNQFTLKDAYSHFHSDEGFCLRVCQMRLPFDYISVKKKITNKLVGNYLTGQVPKLKDDEYFEKARHSGCPKFNPQ